MFIIIGLILVVVIIFFFYSKKDKIVNNSEDLINEDNTKVIIKDFIDEIVLDYYNEYRINYLSVRYDIKELKSEISYVFKTKKIGTLANLLDFHQVSTGEKSLNKLISEKYSITVPVNSQLSFITEVSRIEGKIKAVESVKYVLSEENYKSQIDELGSDIKYYINKFS